MLLLCHAAAPALSEMKMKMKKTELIKNSTTSHLLRISMITSIVDIPLITDYNMLVTSHNMLHVSLITCYYLNSPNIISSNQKR